MSEHESEALKAMLSKDIAFKRLYDKHHRLDQQVNEANEGHLAIDEMALEKLKKEKLLLKDEMNRFIFEFGKNEAVA